MTDKDLNKIGQLIDQKLEPINHKLDSLTADMVDVQTTTKATYELVKGAYEKNKEEIDEIKDHLKLPRNSSLLESLKTA